MWDVHAVVWGQGSLSEWDVLLQEWLDFSRRHENGMLCYKNVKIVAIAEVHFVQHDIRFREVICGMWCGQSKGAVPVVEQNCEWVFRRETASQNEGIHRFRYLMLQWFQKRLSICFTGCMLVLSWRVGWRVYSYVKRRCSSDLLMQMVWICYCNGSKKLKTVLQLSRWWCRSGVVVVEIVGHENYVYFALYFFCLR